MVLPSTPRAICLAGPSVGDKPVTQFAEGRDTQGCLARWPSEEIGTGMFHQADAERDLTTWISRHALGGGHHSWLGKDRYGPPLLLRMKKLSCFSITY